MILQENNYKVKSLSPAISAFQFQTKSTSSSSLSSSKTTVKEQHSSLRCITPIDILTTPLTEDSNDYFSSNNKSYQSSPNTPTILPKEEGYIYKDQHIILSEETKLKLLKMGQLPLDAEWTFWFDK